jgi:hypothetical protein
MSTLWLVWEYERRVTPTVRTVLARRQDLMISMLRAGAMHAAGRASNHLQAPFSIQSWAASRATAANAGPLSCSSFCSLLFWSSLSSDPLLFSPSGIPRLLLLLLGRCKPRAVEHFVRKVVGDVS